MINLNVDFALLTKFFGVPLSRVTQYKNKDLEEIMKLEANQGNDKAKEYKKILSDPDKILQIFKLSNVENKFIILQNLSEIDLDRLLPLLTPEQLSKGLHFFNDEKLLSMMNELPIDEIANIVFEKFTLFDVLALMEESAMNTFINEANINRVHAQKHFESLDQKTLEHIFITKYGYEYKDKSKKDYTEHIKKLGEKDFNTFILTLEREQKMNLINGLVEQDDKLINMFKPHDLTKPMDLLMKDEKVKMMKNIDMEFLVPMIQELPLDLTQVVLTQIDPHDFAEIITDDFQDILKSVVLFAPN